MAQTNESRQKTMKTLGEYGCYFLSLVHLAENISRKRIDAVEAYLNALERKWMDGEATMLNPVAVLGSMTGLTFSVRKESAEYRVKDDEYEVLLFTNGTYNHFVLGDGTGGVAYDPLGDSRTVATGKCIGKRIFARA